ncbi:MAG: type I methionyl aminopeptidase [Chloroflexi bacterium]|nr:MAG: type I methionyl aminopeptidase [Chloroflexota bacterium]
MREKIEYKGARELERIRAAGIIVAETLELMRAHAQPGVTTRQLDALAEEYIRSRGGQPSFKHYRNYPATLCVAVNDVVVHGIPNDEPLRDGDIVAIDVGVKLDGWHGDATITVPVGEIDAESQRLMDVCKEALDIGIATAQSGAKLSDISYAIEQHVNAAGFAVVRDLFGHGIGRRLHEPPSLPHYGPPGEGPTLRPGLVITIEPMIVAGSPRVNVLSDGWTIITADGKRSAQFEHTVAITSNGPRVLTSL